MPGYVDFATLLARFPELLMVRKFDRLSVQMLLYQQAELLYLEQDLEVFADEDAKNPDTAEIGQCWEKMSQTFAEGKGGLQKEKIEEIQTKLKTYRNENLLRVHQVQKLEAPSEYSHAVLNDWLLRKDGGDGFLRSCESTPWTSKSQTDLITLQLNKDQLDRWLARTLVPIYHHLFGRRHKPAVTNNPNIGPVWDYKMKIFEVMATYICVFLSCGVPLASILSLYFVNSMSLRLVMITMFTVVFSSLVAIVTNAKRSDIFAATVAFAAVQVVFLQGINIAQNT